MNILVAVDTSLQTDFVIQEVARLAGNTWADVTLLGIDANAFQNQGSPPPKAGINPNARLVQILREHRARFLSHFSPEASPYVESSGTYELLEVAPGLWEDLKVCRGLHKQLKTRIRPGNPSKAILTEARQSSYDLIVIGSRVADTSDATGYTAKKVTREADTSVLVLAEAKQPRRIVACLDHDQVSQPSLEMINQMVTLYQADLEIVGLTSSNGGLAGEVDHKMAQIFKYYASNGIKALVRLVGATSLQAFAGEMARENLLALWMGRKSLLRRFIPIKSLDLLLSSPDSSVLILR